MAAVVIRPVLEYRRSRGWRKLAEIGAALPENFAAGAGQRGGKAERGSPVKGERGRFPFIFWGRDALRKVGACPFGKGRRERTIAGIACARPVLSSRLAVEGFAVPVTGINGLS